MSKHTPAPWKPIYVSGICIGIGTDTPPYHEMVVNTILPDTDKEYKKERATIEANARLIASAPELLEALKEALNALGGNDPQDLGFEDSICGKIRQAIAKAEGKP